MDAQIRESDVRRSRKRLFALVGGVLTVTLMGSGAALGVSSYNQETVNLCASALADQGAAADALASARDKAYGSQAVNQRRPLNSWNPGVV